MSNQEERDRFMVRCGLSVETARTLLRHAATLQRLAEAQCNGDYPYDDGQRRTEPCPLCETYVVPESIQGGAAAWLAATAKEKGAVSAMMTSHDRSVKACPDCRTSARVRALLEGTQWQAYVQGDPRGYVLRLFPRFHMLTHKGDNHEVAQPVTYDDMYCGRVNGLGVPTR